MPLYEYQCEACGHRFEVIQKYSDAPIATCEKCGGAVHKLFSSPAIQFKGSGWYITDYARAGKTESSTGSAKADAANTESKTDGKTDSKTETKSDTKNETKGTSSPTPASSSSTS